MIKKVKTRRRKKEDFRLEDDAKSRIKLYLSLMRKKEYIFILIISIAVWLIGFVALSNVKINIDFLHTGFKFSNFLPKSSNTSTNIANCFTCKPATLYDPYLLSQKIRSKDDSFVIVDLRSREEYMSGHIRTAISIPTYTSLENIEKTERPKADIVYDFAKIHSKNIVIYGSSSTSSITNSIHDLLSQNHISSIVLSIGWNEWYNFRNAWVPEGQWDSFDPDNYSVLGK